MQFEEELDQKPKKLSLSLWARVLKLARNHWRKLGECMLMLALIGVGEALPPLMTRYAVDTFVVGKNMATLGWFIGIYVIMLILDFAASFRFLQLSGRIEWGVNYDIRARGFRKLQELPFSYYDRMPVGNLLTRVTSDTAQIGEALGWGMVDFVWAIFFLLSSFVAMIALNWQLALAAFLSLPVLALISLYFQKKMIGNQRKIRRTNSMITAAFNEGIMGAKTTKTLVREDMNFEEFQELTSKMHKRSIYAAVISSLFFPIVSSVGAIATAYVLTEGAGLVLTGAMSLGTIAAFISPTEEIRQMAEHIIGQDDFKEIFVSTPLEVCEQRDVKGLYARARRGEIQNFTGISAPFEAPEHPALSLDTSKLSIEESVKKLLTLLGVE